MSQPRIAITAVFALNGFLFASMFARMPAIKERAGLGAGALGLALLCAMFGLLVSQVAPGPLVARHGSRPLVLTGALGYAAGLLPVALSTSFATLAGSLLLVGLMNGVLDVSMNVHGLTVERRIGQAILATLHAGFSFGVLAGASVGGIVAGAGVAVVPHLAATAVAGAAAALAAARFLLPRHADALPDGARFVRPSRRLVAVGAFAFCALLSEGAVNDWAAVYLNEDLDAGEALAAGGLAAFSLTMAICRLVADRLTEALGQVMLARGGGALAAAGVALAILASDPAGAIAGFAAAGMGLAVLFPLALRAAAQRGDSPGPGVSAVSAMGYLGFLAGPPAVGGSRRPRGWAQDWPLSRCCAH